MGIMWIVPRFRFGLYCLFYTFYTLWNTRSVHVPWLITFVRISFHLILIAHSYSSGSQLFIIFSFFFGGGGWECWIRSRTSFRTSRLIRHSYQPACVDIIWREVPIALHVCKINIFYVFPQFWRLIGFPSSINHVFHAMEGEGKGTVA